MTYITLLTRCLICLRIGFSHQVKFLPLDNGFPLIASAMLTKDKYILQRGVSSDFYNTQNTKTLLKQMRCAFFRKTVLHVLVQYHIVPLPPYCSTSHFFFIDLYASFIYKTRLFRSQTTQLLILFYTSLLHSPLT